jgi:hypothetical protein
MSTNSSRKIKPLFDPVEDIAHQDQFRSDALGFSKLSTANVATAIDLISSQSDPLYPETAELQEFMLQMGLHRSEARGILRHVRSLLYRLEVREIPVEQALAELAPIYDEVGLDPSAIEVVAGLVEGLQPLAKKVVEGILTEDSLVDLVPSLAKLQTDVVVHPIFHPEQESRLEKMMPVVILSLVLDTPGLSEQRSVHMTLSPKALREIIERLERVSAKADSISGMLGKVTQGPD